MKAPFLLPSLWVKVLYKKKSLKRKHAKCSVCGREVLVPGAHGAPGAVQGDGAAGAGADRSVEGL